MSNRTDFADYIVQWAQSNPQRIDLCEAEMYAFDVKDGNNSHTSFTDDSTYSAHAFKVVNQEPQIDVTHICVDGGLIEYGKWDYVGDGKIHGRNDCLIISDDQLIFVELKTEITSEDDKNIWKNFNSGAKQIKDFYIYFRNLLESQGRPISSFFPNLNSNVLALVCIYPYPKLTIGPRKIPMTNRQKDLEKFRIATGGLKVFSKTSYKLGTSILE